LKDVVREDLATISTNCTAHNYPHVFIGRDSSLQTLKLNDGIFKTTSRRILKRHCAWHRSPSTLRPCSDAEPHANFIVTFAEGCVLSY
jgi:hypothetical protein